MVDKVLPEEIKIDILSRLPAKSIGRFRCVSRQWRNLLSQPYFINTHLNVVKDGGQQEGLILKSWSPNALYCASLSNAHQVFDEITVSASMLHFAGIPDSWTLVSSCCDGLVLGTDGRHCLFVVNPTTREIRVVPSLPYDFDRKDVKHGFGYIKYGFGYDSVRDDYKIVVHISVFDVNDSWDDVPDAFLYVYSFRDGDWKMGKCPHFEAEYEAGVFLDGHIYWIGVIGDCVAALVDYDLENEAISYLPHHFKYGDLAQCQIVLIGELLLITDLENNYYLREECADEEESWSWTNLGVKGSGIWTDSTVFNDPYFDTSIKYGSKQPLCLSGQDEMVWRIQRRVGIYNFKEQTLKKIVVRGVQDYYPEITYTETLVSPNNIQTGRR